VRSCLPRCSSERSAQPSVWSRYPPQTTLTVELGQDETRRSHRRTTSSREHSRLPVRINCSLNTSKDRGHTYRADLDVWPSIPGQLWSRHTNSSLVVGASDLWLNGREFYPWPPHYRSVGTGWMIVFRQRHWHTTWVCNQPPRPTQPGQDKMASLGWKMSTGQSICGDTLRLGVKAGRLILFVGWQVKLCDPFNTCHRRRKQFRGPSPRQGSADLLAKHTCRRYNRVYLWDRPSIYFHNSSLMVSVS